METGDNDLNRYVLYPLKSSGGGDAKRAREDWCNFLSKRVPQEKAMKTVDMDLTRSFLPLPTGGGDGVTSSGKGPEKKPQKKAMKTVDSFLYRFESDGDFFYRFKSSGDGDGVTSSGKGPEKKPQEKAMETVVVDLTCLSLYPLESSGGGDGVTSSGKGPEKTPQEKAMEWLRKFDPDYCSESDESQLHPYVSWVDYQDEIRSQLYRVDKRDEKVYHLFPDDTSYEKVYHLFPDEGSYEDYVLWTKDYLSWSEDKEYKGFDQPDDYNKDDDRRSVSFSWISPVDLESVSEDHPDININQLLNLAIEEYNKKNGTNYSFVAIHKANEQEWGIGYNFFVTFHACAPKKLDDDDDAPKLFEALLWEGFYGDTMVRFCRLKNPSA